MVPSAPQLCTKETAPSPISAAAFAVCASHYKTGQVSVASPEPKRINTRLKKIIHNDGQTGKQ